MVILYNKSSIMWKWKMQKTKTLSTAEAEYYSASAAGCEVQYLQTLPGNGTRPIKAPVTRKAIFLLEFLS
jgi:hypothetical protein